MANQLYGYNPSSYSSSATPQPPPPPAPASTIDPYLPDHSLRYFGTTDLFPSSQPSSTYSMFHHRLNNSSVLRYSATANPHLVSQPSWSTSEDPLLPANKRSSDALYHQSYLGSQTTIGQTEAWYSPDSLAKRPRFESASHLPIYPQRPGEKDCAHYMLTRNCKFGDGCKFDHPIWVPEGGIPDWKEVPPIAESESLPARLGEPDCPYFLKTQRCKFGLRCKFNHPKDQLAILGTSENFEISTLPERPSEPSCAFYMKTGQCKFGLTCKFHHPKVIQFPMAAQENCYSEQIELAIKIEDKAGDVNFVTPLVSFAPALLHNSKGLPVRPDEVDCPFYLKTGSCKYGGTCRYNHPDRNAINPLASAIGHPNAASQAASLNIGVANPTATIYQDIHPRLPQSTLGVAPTVYPQRPGQIECDFYMKTGECKFEERCRFHHPIDRSAPTAMQAQQAVKLTLAGLPRREGAAICPYYMKTGTCKFGTSCKFDHPPPGEVMGMAVTQGTVTSEEAKGDGNGASGVEEQQQ